MSEKQAQRVVLVAWPAADWRTISRLLDAGELPQLRQILERGVLGHLPGLSPEVEPLLYTCVATGVTADRHGILSAKECGPARKTKALWNILSDAGMRSIVVNWPGQFAAEAIEGVGVTADFPFGQTGTISPETIFPSALGPALAGLCGNPNDLHAGVHSVTTRLMENERWDFAAVSYGLIQTAWLQWAGHEKRWPASLDAAYRLSDTMLGEVAALAGEDAAILLVSASGLRAGSPDSHAAQRLLPWYSTRGFCCLAAPGTKHGYFLQGAGLLDIAPTVLALLGLPVARDMQGRPLLQALTNFHPPAFIPTWEDDRSERSQHMSVGLGRECALNQAAVYLDTARPQQAIPILQELLKTVPGDEACGLALAYAYVVAAEWEQLRGLLAFLADTERTSPLLLVMRAMLSVVGGNVAEALALLKECERAASGFPMLAYGIGCVYLRLRKWRRAERAFRMAAERNPEFWLPQQAQAWTLTRLGRRREAAELLRAGIHTNFAASGWHYLLGTALSDLRDRAGVWRSFSSSLIAARTAQ